MVCGDEVCGDCGHSLGDLGRCCKKHGDINAALHNEHNVKVYSNNYKGKITSPRFSKYIETPFYTDKEEATRALRFITAINGGDIVQSVEFVRSTGEDGNYRYSIWQANGVV